jgi:bifunctional UDP-N-acetylglucosamine pyrophosphorylase/glucosamine-1-phosphate N-acetyltransferase
MNSSQVKVLHKILGKPMVAYAIDLALSLNAAPVVAVLGYQRPSVAQAIEQRFGVDQIKFVEQKEQKGTGHAARLGLTALSRFNGTVLILCGDTPILREETLAALLTLSRKHKALAMVTSQVPDAMGYGRIVRDSAGKILNVVEHKDASAAERRITEINAGIYAAPVDFLRKALQRLPNDNAQGEYYLTEIITRAAATIGVYGVEAPAEETAGINDRAQLVATERLLVERLVAFHQRHVTFRDPHRVEIEAEVSIDADVEIGRDVALRGRTRIGAGAIIGDGVILTDCDVGPGAVILPYCVATQSTIGEKAKIGPFAHLRPATVLGPDVHIGNFVETKKSTLGRGSKANHLSYLGDSIIGEKVNVGAGTITCNYNGFEKRQTIIEDGAFIGSDTQLIAPVRVGKKAVIAAGATITEDVKDGALAISRVPLKQIDGYAARLAERYPKKRS